MEASDFNRDAFAGGEDGNDKKIQIDDDKETRLLEGLDFMREKETSFTRENDDEEEESEEDKKKRYVSKLYEVFQEKVKIGL